MENSERDGEYQTTWSASGEIYMQVKEQQLDWTWNRLDPGYILSPCLFNLYAEYIMWNAGLDEAQVGIKIARNINNLRYADDSTLTAESEEELKSLLMKENSEKLA